MRQWKKYLKCLTLNIHSHTPKSFSPSWPWEARWSALFTGKGKNGCLVTQPSNLLGSLQSADIWPVVVHKGDHDHTTMTTALLLQWISYRVYTLSSFLLSHRFFCLHFSQTLNQKLTQSFRSQKSTDSATILSSGQTVYKLVSYLYKQRILYKTDHYDHYIWAQSSLPFSFVILL